MYQLFDIEHWKRKDTYYFFKTYDDPVFNLCAPVDVTALYNFCKSHHHSFSLAMLFYCLQTANEIEEFRLRFLDNDLVLYDSIHCGATILNDDETFSFCRMEYADTLTIFETEGRKKIIAQQAKKTLDPNVDVVNIIYFSLIPWVSFTNIKHASASTANKSIPKIAIGKYFSENNAVKVPVSVEVNHALMDGLHAGKYFNLLQQKINELR